MKFLHSTELIEEYRGIKPFQIRFRDGMNVIVGDNGSGKTTLMQLIRAQHSGNSIYSERRLLRTICDNCQFIDIIEAAEATILKTGSWLESLGKPIERKQSKLIIADCPEAHLSIQSQVKLRDLFKRLQDVNQIILATHSAVFSEMVDEVYDMDINAWVNSKAWLLRARGHKSWVLK